MGKGFQNFMSKKDFHPGAWWNLKKVWEAKEKKKLDETKQEELRVQYEKEQEMLNNKALLGDEKAKLGLSFMYDAPTGMTKREEPKEEPKFEWQRKYNAPREEWAKGNDAIQDQPFGIQVRNVRCVKCHTWGHLNTDMECPLFNMSGNADNPGQVTNPSDVLKELRDTKKAEKTKKKKQDDSGDEEDAYEGEAKLEPIPQMQLLTEMRDDHGFQFKSHILHNLRSDDVLSNLKTEKKPENDYASFLSHLTNDQRKRILVKTFGKNSKEYLDEKERQKAAKVAKKEAKKAKKESSSSSEDDQVSRRGESSRRQKKSDKHPKHKKRSRTPERRSRRQDDSPERSERGRKRPHEESSHYHGTKKRRDSDECREKSRNRKSDSYEERKHRSRYSRTPERQRRR